MSLMSAAYLGLVITGFVAFGVSLLSVQIYTSLKPRRRTVKAPASRPATDSEIELRGAARG